MKAEAETEIVITRQIWTRRGAPAIPRRMAKSFGPPMTLANMRHNGVRYVTAECEACGHKADVNVDGLAETIPVPEAGRRLRCSRCGGKRISTRPAWHTK
jgi:hypothetical protein